MQLLQLGTEGTPRLILRRIPDREIPEYQQLRIADLVTGPVEDGLTSASTTTSWEDAVLVETEER
jgi:hypothetical protein